MKKLPFILTLMLLPLLVSAQSTKSRVVLKNGTELTGIIKSIDPTDAVKIVIAGVETSIKMADIAKIEELDQMPSNMPSSANVQTELKEKLRVTDFADYPESFDVKVGDQTIKMILVRGGDMNMGFDGRHSRAMNSEPVHKVGITSFYISETFVTSKIVSEVSEKSSNKDYCKTSWKKASEIVTYIANKAGLPIRLPTEAEWEYAACSQVQERIFNKCKEFEFCNDNYDDFKEIEYRVDPTGPDKAKYGSHVVRAYSQEKGKLSRMGSPFDNFFRIAIKADNIKL